MTFKVSVRSHFYAPFNAFRCLYAPDRSFTHVPRSTDERFLKATTSSYQLCAEITFA